ncbi:hypothetical protein ACEZDB_26925 [Streptacidiphilus sp. N1-3]|uniref:Uncharacterized protein n=1 Tax=Streptacidiphilus alkalitolerans TaxID=3342712 RepID=A0ABV6X8D4_9ACTN
MPDVLGPCPAWCSGVHHTKDELPVDQGHQSAPIMLQVPVSGRQVDVLEAFISQYPNALVSRADVYAAVDLGSDFYEVTTEDLDALARGLEVHAQRLRQLGRDLTEARRI